MDRLSHLDRSRSLHPFHATLLAGMLPLFLGTALSDIAYARSFEIQWTNFAAWLGAGALVYCGFTLLWAAIDLFRARRRSGRAWTYVALLLATFVMGFIGALFHARDAWGSMPAGLYLSIVTFLLAVAAVWVGLSRDGEGAGR